MMDKQTELRNARAEVARLEREIASQVIVDSLEAAGYTEADMVSGRARLANGERIGGGA